MFVCLFFQCSILQNGNAVQSVQVTEMNVIEKLKFVSPPASKGLEIGSVGKIHCKVQGTPTPKIQWTKVSSFFFLPIQHEHKLLNHLKCCIHVRRFSHEWHGDEMSALRFVFHIKHFQVNFHFNWMGFILMNNYYSHCVQLIICL